MLKKLIVTQFNKSTILPVLEPKNIFGSDHQVNRMQFGTVCRRIGQV